MDRKFTITEVLIELENGKNNRQFCNSEGSYIKFLDGVLEFNLKQSFGDFCRDWTEVKVVDLPKFGINIEQALKRTWLTTKPLRQK